MTTKQPEKTKQERRRRPVFIPDPPKHKDGEMTSFDHLSLNGNAHYLVHHFSNLETAIVTGEHYLMAAPRVPRTERRIPDLLIAFNADPELYKANNAYIISEQGKPPDFIMEIASQGTWRRDRYAKREDYLAMGIPEYWRFDETGRYYGEPLGGDLLVGGEYRPIAIETLAEGVLQGYSPSLNLLIRWEHGELKWYDPVAEAYVATLESEREARLRSEQERLRERQARQTLEAQLEEERRARRELEEQLRQRGQLP